MVLSGRTSVGMNWDADIVVLYRHFYGFHAAHDENFLLISFSTVFSRSIAFDFPATPVCWGQARGNLNWIQVKRVDWDGDAGPKCQPHLVMLDN